MGNLFDHIDDKCAAKVRAIWKEYRSVLQLIALGESPLCDRCTAYMTEHYLAANQSFAATEEKE